MYYLKKNVSCILLHNSSLSPRLSHLIPINMSYQQFKRGESLKVIGPYGSAAEGNSFDHGIHSAVRQLVMGSIPPIGISFIQIQYYDDDNGTSSWTDKHGISESSLYNSNTETTTIKLDYPDEFLTSVYGYYDKPGLKQNYICSLTFKSNKRTYGPFGEERGNYFSTKVNGAMIVGFHGRSGIHGLLAIGVYMKPLNPYRPPKSLLPPAGHSLQIKLEKDDHNTKKQAPNIVVSNNQVCGNEGDRNGTFAVGCTYKYITQYYNQPNVKYEDQ